MKKNKRDEINSKMDNSEKFEKKKNKLNKKKKINRMDFEQINTFLNNEEINEYGITISEKSETKITISILDSFDMTITEKKEGTFITSTEEELLDEVVEAVNTYCEEGKKSIEEVLKRINKEYKEKIDDEEIDMDSDDDDEEEEEEILDPEELDDLIMSTEESMYQDLPKKKKKKDDEFTTQELNETKDKFDINTNANNTAIDRLMKDYLQLTKNDTSKFGFVAKPRGKDLFNWDVKIIGFEKSEPIQQDLMKLKARTGQGYVLFHMKFPQEYPYKPPFIRVVSPRMVFHTGHVTIGGSICMELLTSSGWMPSNTIESIFVQIRCAMITGKCRIDFKNTTDYSEHEAREAFTRVAKHHNWEI